MLLGVLGCVTILPSLILVLDKPLQRTRHKSLIPDMGGFAKGVCKIFPVFLAIFALLIAPAYISYDKTNDEVYYDMGQCLPEDMEYVIANKKLSEEFDIASTHMLLVNADLPDSDVRAMIDEMEQVPGVKYVLGMESVVGPMIPMEVLPDSVRSMLESDQWELLLINSEYKVASDDVDQQIDQLNAILKKYDEGGMLIGEAPCMKDMIETTDHDFKVVNAISIAAIFLIITLVEGSFSLPFILIAVIELAIFINLGLPHVLGQSLPFIAPICISTIQLGATVDYAILMTTRYKAERLNGEDKKKAVMTALRTSAPSIIVSGMGLFAATFGVALYSNIDIVGSMCMLMARGAIISVLLVLLVEVMFLYSTTRSYYNGVQQTMYRRFSSITGQLKMYTGETSQKTAASRSVALRRMVEQFSDKDKYEFMLLDSYGGVIASSSGTDAEGIVTSTDFEQAQEAMDGQGVAIYRTQSGEMVMAACCLVPYAAEDVAAMRLVTSLTLVGQQLKRTAVVALIMGTAVLAFTIMSGLYFVRSIVVPLGQVERTAASIARGELDVRLPVTGDERDEVDRLRGTINRMAEGLEETEKMKNEFISSVSHELRTPLTSIRGWVETLRTLDDPADENYRKGLEIISNETARLYNMVEELLDFSRLQNGRLKMTCRPLDLVAELTDAVLFCEARIQREGLVLVYNEPEEMIPVYADPDRLRQVFINIMDNAIKYSAPGGRITVKLWAGEYKAFVEILDQGRGIPPEDLENVKTKFYKGSNSVRGSGIGLALVDSIMTALDGTMDIKSTLGRGTVVTLGLPLYKK